MVCSEKELGLSEEHEGILFLPDDAPVGVPLADYLGDTVLDLDLTPNLARCFSLVGVAREVAALTGAMLRYPDSGWRAEGSPASDLARVEIEDPDLCARYIAAIIRDVEIAPSPPWMQERLRRAGMRPISNVVDITNYVMLEWGQPLHAFDYDKLVARAGGGRPTIIVRRARPGETMTTLDGVEPCSVTGTLLICDTAGPIAVAGVMGGLETESTNTRATSCSNRRISTFSACGARRRSSNCPARPACALAGIHPALAEPAARRASE
jgi:phenylalanyl-tRNA synthetase beta chain